MCWINPPEQNQNQICDGFDQKQDDWSPVSKVIKAWCYQCSLIINLVGPISFVKKGDYTRYESGKVPVVFKYSILGTLEPKKRRDEFLAKVIQRGHRFQGKSSVLYILQPIFRTAMSAPKVNYSIIFESDSYVHGNYTCTDYRKGGKYPFNVWGDERRRTVRRSINCLIKNVHLCTKYIRNLGGRYWILGYIRSRTKY